jgi:hypothetical protein
VVLEEKPLLYFPIPISDLPQHPSYRFVNQVLIVVPQDAGDGQGIHEIPFRM